MVVDKQDQMSHVKRYILNCVLCSTYWIKVFGSGVCSNVSSIVLCPSSQLYKGVKYISMFFIISVIGTFQEK